MSDDNEKKAAKDLPDKVEVPSFYASTIEQDYIHTARKYNSLKEGDPKRVDLYNKLMDLQVEQLFD